MRIRALQTAAAMWCLVLSGSILTAADLPALAQKITNSIGMRFRLIPAGSFQMGSDKGTSDEKPVHKVTLTKPFYTWACTR